MRIDASAVLAATTAGGASPDVWRNDTAWCATTSSIDRPFAASTHADRDESRIASKDSGELCRADIRAEDSILRRMAQPVTTSSLLDQPSWVKYPHTISTSASTSASIIG